MVGNHGLAHWWLKPLQLRSKRDSERDGQMGSEFPQKNDNDQALK